MHTSFPPPGRAPGPSDGLRSLCGGGGPNGAGAPPPGPTVAALAVTLLAPPPPSRARGRPT